MTGITHAFTSAKSDGGDATLVRPSDWNAGHVVSDIVDLPTAETDTDLVLAPDGVGGVEFRAEAAPAGGGDEALAYIYFGG